MIVIITAILCRAMRNEKEQKKPHRPNHTKADGVKRKGREHYGSDMLIFMFMQTQCQCTGTYLVLSQSRFQNDAKSVENSRIRCGVFVFSGIVSRGQDLASVYLRVALCLE